MTFEEWFDKTYPYDDIVDTFGYKDFKNALREAWYAALSYSKVVE